MNSIRFLSPATHSLLDYAAAAGPIGLAILLSCDGLALWSSIAGGIGLIGYNLITDYAFGLTPLLSVKGHLLLDFAAAGAFVSTPLLFCLERAKSRRLPVNGRRRDHSSCAGHFKPRTGSRSNRMEWGIAALIRIPSANRSLLARALTKKPNCRGKS
jgi:hypothetical protein